MAPLPSPAPSPVPSPTWAGRRVAVSGAGGGIGRAAARRFADEGASVVLIDRSPELLERSLDDIRRGPGGGGAVRGVLCDQTCADDIGRAVAETGPVDVFVNSAGIVLRKPLLDTGFDEFDRVLRVNVTGCVAMATGMARAMIAGGGAGGGGGVIVNVGSQLGFMTGVDRGAYSASKAALAQFTRTAGLEWIRLGVRVVSVAPGPVDTPMTADLRADADGLAALTARMPIGRMIEADEISRIILFLASPAAAAIVGQTLVADGGWMLT